MSETAPFLGFSRATLADWLVDPSATADDSVHQVYDQLRADGGVTWVEPAGFRPFWAVTSHAAITTVSKANDRFVNRFRTYLAPAAVEAQTLAMTGDTHLFRTLVDTDDPLHMKLRKITHTWFLPPSLKRLEAGIRDIAREHVDRMAALGGACDFVNEIALYYPLRVIMRILGLPPEDEPQMLRMTQEIFGAGDPDVIARSKLITTNAGLSAASSGDPTVDLFALAQEYFAYFAKVTADRRAHPRDDASSLIANGLIDGEPIGDREAMSYYVIVATAGHDTTSSTAAGGLRQLIANPAELAKLQADPALISAAVEEMIRWVTPVKHFMRTATEDCTLAGQAIRAGDSLCLFYASGNRDAAVFAEPDRFIADRSLNPHTAFGNGVHLCLGLHLARLELRILFEELLPRLREIGFTGEPRNSVSNFVSGLKTLPISYRMH